MQLQGSCCIVIPAPCRSIYLIHAHALLMCARLHTGASWSQASAKQCVICGDGINSEARDVDEHPLAINGSLVRATTASCSELCDWHLLFVSVCGATGCCTCAAVFESHS